MPQSSSNSSAEPDQQRSAMADEIQRLRRLVLKLMNEQSANGQKLTLQQSNEIKVSLQSAWEELERKQSYLESTFGEIASLKEQLAAQSGGASSSQVAELTASLHEAWAELERKQSHLEGSVAQAAELQGELARLRGGG